MLLVLGPKDQSQPLFSIVFIPKSPLPVSFISPPIFCLRLSSACFNLTFILLPVSLWFLAQHPETSSCAFVHCLLTLLN